MRSTRVQAIPFCPGFPQCFLFGEDIFLSLLLQATKLLPEYNQTLPDEKEFQNNREIQFKWAQGILTGFTLAWVQTLTILLGASHHPISRSCPCKSLIPLWGKSWDCLEFQVMFFVLLWRLLLTFYLYQENLNLSYLDPLENELLEKMGVWNQFRGTQFWHF